MSSGSASDEPNLRFGRGTALVLYSPTSLHIQAISSGARGCLLWLKRYRLSKGVLAQSPGSRRECRLPLAPAPARTWDQINRSFRTRQAFSAFFAAAHLFFCAALILAKPSAENVRVFLPSAIGFGGRPGLHSVVTCLVADQFRSARAC